MNDSFVNQPGKLFSILSYEVKVAAHVDHEQAFQHLWNKIVMVLRHKTNMFAPEKKMIGRHFPFEIVPVSGDMSHFFLGEGYLLSAFCCSNCFLPMALFHPASVFATGGISPSFSKFSRQ